ncbi:MAG TPA: helix-turn-helix domain-containing protein [Azospirillaceae bacterium]|nr:helix-turn-helix domain-containing protein [Azospirillaceae bacterium]
MPRKSKNSEANAIDALIENHVAGRIRLRRGLLGMSQSDLARALGITFQQVQKYERGTNRVSTAKLYRLGEILDVPLSFFFDDLEVPGLGKPRQDFDTQGAESLDLTRRELDLLRAWRAAPPAVADAVAALVRRVGGTDDEETGPDAEETRSAMMASMEGDNDDGKPRRRRGAVWDPADIRPKRR